jgi:hypothetical protein
LQATGKRAYTGRCAVYGGEVMADSTSNEHTSDGEASDADFDLDAEWSRAREAAGLDAEAQSSARGEQLAEPLAEVSPLTLVYTGFFLGPPATLLVSILLMGRGLTLRSAAFALGVCGAGWCLIQAATFGLAGDWSVVELQVLRTAANFAMGLALIWYLRRHTDAAFGHDRQTLINTLVLGGVMVAVNLLLAESTLVWLGR